MGKIISDQYKIKDFFKKYDDVASSRELRNELIFHRILSSCYILYFKALSP